MSFRFGRICLLALAVIAASARDAAAQWFVAALLGANVTQPATVSVRVPASSIDVQFHDVEFEGRPFESPQYYTLRVGRWLDKAATIGVDFELIHLKVISKTGRAYSTTGTVAGAPWPTGQPMASVVERYSMTHGLNFFVGNVVVRRPIGSGRASLIVRGGAGITAPHTETTVLGVAVDKYEYAGLGAQASVGLNVTLSARWSVMGEYKYTYARPEITVSSGTGRMTAATHQIAGGLAFGLSR